MQIEKRLWLPQAMGLLPNADDKIIHKGCGDRPSLFIKNDPDKYWCWCHRCHSGGWYDKEVPRIKQKMSIKTGWMPEEMIPVIQAVVEQPYNFRDLFDRFNLAPYVTLLQFSPDTKRIYFPDESKSYLGLDATFKANARFYSPLGRNLCVSSKGNDGRLLVTSNLVGYLESVRTGTSSILVMNSGGERSALALLSEHADSYTDVKLDRLRPAFVRDVKPFL